MGKCGLVKQSALSSEATFYSRTEPHAVDSTCKGGPDFRTRTTIITGSIVGIYPLSLITTMFATLLSSAAVGVGTYQRDRFQAPPSPRLYH